MDPGSHPADGLGLGARSLARTRDASPTTLLCFARFGQEKTAVRNDITEIRLGHKMRAWLEWTRNARSATAPETSLHGRFRSGSDTPQVVLALPRRAGGTRPRLSLRLVR